ncbi:MAG: flagellar basal body P-ring formation protein FlgA [Planctomycetes bacterium]|nr:flagellar basal body P-ring formation protein FlgA [Planctomycetota bacterium]
MRLVLTALFLCTGLNALQQADSAVPPTAVVLKLDAAVSEPYVRVRDIADVSGPAADGVARLVLAAPDDFPVHISAASVSASLSRWGRDVEVRGASYCKVVRAGAHARTATSPTDALVDVLAAAALKAMTGHSPDTVLSLAAFNVFSDDGPVPPENVASTSVEGSGDNRDTCWVRFTGTDKLGHRLWGWARFNVSIKQMAVVSARSLSRGQLLTREDVELAEVKLAPGRAACFSSLSEVTGRKVLAPAPPGHILSPTDIERPVLVPRNTEVNVIVHGRGFRLIDRALCRDDGALGEIVRVQNLRSREIFRARVISEDTVVPVTGKEQG